MDEGAGRESEGLKWLTLERVFISGYLEESRHSSIPICGLASLMGEGESFLVRHLRGGLLRGMRVTCLRSRAYLASVGGISREGCQLHTLPLSLPSPRT